MAKKVFMIALGLIILAGGIFMIMRRSHTMGSSSQTSSGGLVAVSANGDKLPVPASAGSLPENSAAQETGGMLVTLGIDPYPPSGGPTNFVVSLVDASGQPVSDATIGLDLTMPSMWMPANQLDMKAGQAGKYQASGYFTMRGLWRIEVIITRGGQKQSFLFDVGL